jgi:hypothetical protein
MTDDELRALVRASVARHLGHASAPAPVLPAPAPPRAIGVAAAFPWQEHTSHQQYLAIVNVDSACVIEPAVACDHCGYCKSHGH